MSNGIATYHVPVFFEDPEKNKNAACLIVTVQACHIVQAIDFVCEHTPGWFHIGEVTSE